MPDPYRSDILLVRPAKICIGRQGNIFKNELCEWHFLEYNINIKCFTHNEDIIAMAVM